MENMLGIKPECKDDVQSVYVSQSEGANFWLGMINNLKQRVTKAFLIACIDNTKGLEEAIFTVYPTTKVESRIVH